MAEYLGGIGQRAHIVLHLAVVLQQLDGQIAGGVAFAQGALHFQVFLYLLNAVFYLVSVVDVDVPVVGVLILGALISLDDGLEQFGHSLARGEDCGHHRHAEQARERVNVDVVAASLGLVKHVQGAHHAQVHVDELRGEVEVALEVGRVYHVDHHVGRLLDDLLAHVKFLGRVGRE